MEDFCGFWLDTSDGNIWAVGDSRLMEEHLHMRVPDAILFDFSDSKWHIGLEEAVKMAAAYLETPLNMWDYQTSIYDILDGLNRVVKEGKPVISVFPTAMRGSLPRQTRWHQDGSHGFPEKPQSVWKRTATPDSSMTL